MELFITFISKPGCFTYDDASTILDVYIAPTAFKLSQLQKFRPAAPTVKEKFEKLVESKNKAFK